MEVSLFEGEKEGFFCLADRGRKRLKEIYFHLLYLSQPIKQMRMQTTDIFTREKVYLSP